MTDFLALSKIYKSFIQGSERVDVLKDINFRFDFDKSYAIIGASGAGKSTLIHILSGTDLPNSGDVSWGNGLKINQLSEQQKDLFWSRDVGLMFQQPGLINELTVLENVILKGVIGHQQDVINSAKKLLRLVGLHHRLDFFPDVLSKGEQQRVAIARALICKPKLILADEPTGSLDKKTGTQIIDFLIELQKKYNIGLIVSTHDEYVYHKMDAVLQILDCKLNLVNDNFF